MEEADLMTLITTGTIPEFDYSAYDDVLDYPHLFNSVNDDFSSPGTPLPDALTCTVTWNSNQFPTLQMTYPRDGRHMSAIAKNKYLLADINRKFTHQIFKITQVQKELDNVIVVANHITATLNDSAVADKIQIQSGSAQDLMNQVLNTMQPQRDITFDSNVDTISNVDIDANQQAGALLINPDQEGDKATQSVLGLFGGELEFDNFAIHHSGHAGQDENIVIDYGKNIQSISQDENIENMYTGAIFTATYTPGQAVATETNTDWTNWSSNYSSVGVTYMAGGSVQIFDSPVEGHQVIGTLSNNQKLHLGTPVSDGSFTPDGKYQINTVNGDSWYPIDPADGGGWIDATWITFDTTGSYLINKISGDITVQASDPTQSEGAGSRISASGYAVVAYKPGGSIHAYYSPEIGPDHYRTGKEYKNGTRVHYDMIERNTQGDIWYRIGSHEWLYGPHLSKSQDGSYQSYSNSGYGYIKDGAVKYHLDKHGQMVSSTKTITVKPSKKSKPYRYVGKGKHKKKVPNKSYWKAKQKKVKITAHKGRAIIDKTIEQGGTTYMHTKYGWVKSSSISYKKDGSVKPKTLDNWLKKQTVATGKVEIYATPDKTNALNWSIPSGTQLTVEGEEAKGGDGKTYVKVSYAGKTGWLPESNIDEKNSHLHSQDDNQDADTDNENQSNTANVDQSQKEVRVVVGPLYANGFGMDPNVDKVNVVDVSSYYTHDNQDLSGQQPDGSFVPTQADIDGVTQIGEQYLIEHRYGRPEVSLTVNYQEMSGINADFTQLSLYDYVYVHFDRYGIQEKAEVNAIVWDCLSHHYQSITIGKLPETYQHLLLEAADKNAADKVRSATRSSNARNTHLFARINDALKKEGSDRKAAEVKLMKDLGLVKQTTDEQGRKIQRALVSINDFDQQIQTINQSVSDISNDILSGGTQELKFLDASGNQNFLHPTQIRAVNSDGSYLDFNSQGLGFFNSGNNLIRSAITASGQVAAEAITAGTINAVTIKSCLINSALTIGKEGGMNVYIGTRNPGSVLNPLHGGNVIWAMSDQYQAMFSSGQIATTGKGGMTRIHPHEVTIGDDMNQALTQVNFAPHAYYRIKSWVKAWVADYITINGKKRTIWKGSNKGVNMKKLRNLKDQGKTDYSYTPKSDDYGDDDSTGIDSGDVDLSDMIPSISDVEAIKEHQQKMQEAVDNFNNFIKTGPSAPLHFVDDNGNQTMQNPTRVVAQGSDHSFELNSNGITYTDSSGNTHAAFGIDESTGELKGNFYVDQAYIPRLDASHIETESIHSLGTINGSLAVSNGSGSSTVQVGMSYGGTEFGVFVGNASLTSYDLNVQSGEFSNINVSSDASIGNMNLYGVTIERNDGMHVMWSGSQHTNLGAYINAHIKSSAIIGGSV